MAWLAVACAGLRYSVSARLAAPLSDELAGVETGVCGTALEVCSPWSRIVALRPAAGILVMGYGASCLVRLAAVDAAFFCVSSEVGEAGLERFVAVWSGE